MECGACDHLNRSLGLVQVDVLPEYRTSHQERLDTQPQAIDPARSILQSVYGSRTLHVHISFCFITTHSPSLLFCTVNLQLAFAGYQLFSRLGFHCYVVCMHDRNVIGSLTNSDRSLCAYASQRQAHMAS